MIGALHIVTIGEFIAVDEPGAAALLGADGDTAVIPQGGDVMVYGVGGSGKTTLVVDLVFHLASGEEWLGIHVDRPLNVLLVENEGPRPQFRRKLARKRAAWRGGVIGDRICVLDEPWGRVSFADPEQREQLAAHLREQETDMLVVGPLTRSGMNEAGTLQDVNEFMQLVNDVRRLAGRAVSVLLVHHENKGGQVSGAWEQAGDTLVHIQAQGNGHTKLYWQKCRWSSEHHGTSAHLTWAEGDSFTVDDRPDRDDNTIADEILEAILQDGGTVWTSIEKSVSGKGERLREIRDRLLAAGRIHNTGTGARTSLWHTDDPSRPNRDDSGTTYTAAPGNEGHESHRPSSRLKRDEDEDDSLDSPATPQLEIA